jgi:hypothetical protein
MAKDGGAGELGLFLTDAAGETFFGTTDGLVPAAAEDTTFDENGLAVAYDGYVWLNLRQSQDRQDELLEYKVPTDSGVITVQTFNAAVIQPSRCRYRRGACAFGRHVRSPGRAGAHSGLAGLYRF